MCGTNSRVWGDNLVTRRLGSPKSNELPRFQGQPLSTTSVTDKPHSKRRKGFIAAGVVALLLGGGGVAAASTHKSVDVDIDGEVVSVGTFSSSVAGALDAAGFEPATHDQVSPEPDAALENGATVTVRTAHQVEFDED